MRRLLFTVLLAGCASTSGGTDTTTPTEHVQSEAATSEETKPMSESNETESMTWTYTGFEVVGYKTTTREALTEDLPVEIGDPASFPDQETVARWQALAEQKAEELGLHYVDYSVVQFGEGDAYFTVEVLEEEDRAIVATREAPTEEMALPPELAELAEAREKRQRSLFNSGNFEQAREVVAETDDGQLYLSNPADEELETINEKLVELAPRHRDFLVRAVGHASSGQVRAQAATLLNWAGNVTTSIAEVLEFTDDPNGLVRNDITRFALHYIDRVESADTKESLVRTMCVQLHRPSHADRNKSIYALLYLLQSDADTAAIVPDFCVRRVEMVAEQSILDNVGGVAKKVLDLLPAD